MVTYGSSFDRCVRPAIALERGRSRVEALAKRDYLGFEMSGEGDRDRQPHGCLISRALYLDRDSPTPSYLQVVDQVVFLVHTGRLSDGTRLPPMRDLARELNVHKNTAERAYRELARRGYVGRKLGVRGLFVVVPDAEDNAAAARRVAAQLLVLPARECLELGLTAEQIRRTVKSMCGDITSIP